MRLLLILALLVVVAAEDSLRGASQIVSDPLEPDDPIVTDPIEPDPIDSVDRPDEPDDPIVSDPIEPDEIVSNPIEPEEEIELDPIISDPSATYEVRLPLLTPDVLSGYRSTFDLRVGIKNMIKLHLNSVIKRNAEIEVGKIIWGGGGGFAGDDFIAAAPGSDAVAGGNAERGSSSSDQLSGGADSSDQVGDDTTDFSTNNQEANVDEADIVKADGTHFFAAYGDYLVVWDKKGNLVYSVRMPLIGFPKQDPIISPYPPVVEEPLVPRDGGEIVDMDANPDDENGPRLEPVSDPVLDAEPIISVSDPVEPQDGEEIRNVDANSDDGNGRRLSSIYYPYVARPSIRSLMLEGTRLVAIVSGYGPALRAHAKIENPIFNNLYDTRIIIFDTTTLFNEKPFLSYVDHRDVNGYYQDGRSIDGKGYIVVSNGFNYYYHLDRLFNRYLSPFNVMTKKEYLKAAKQLGWKLINSVSFQIIQELRYDSKIPRFFELSVFQTKLSSIKGFDSALIAKNFIGKNYVEVIGFDIMAGNPSNETMFTQVGNYETDFGKIKLDRVGSWLPGFGGEVYATEDFIVFAGRTWNWIPGLRGSLQSTCLMGVRVDDDGSLEPAAIGVVNGTILNQFSVDVKDNYMRIATTVDSLWFPQPRMVLVDGEEVEITVPELEPSRTQNHLIVLEIPDSQGILEEVGSVRLGKPNERFTAVRMFDDVGYAVTFERIDPFYVLNLTDPRNPTEVAELNITGFSSYLHPIDKDNSLLLAVGQEATEEGVPVGVQITLFDSTDVENPFVLQRYVVENSTDQWSSTSAQLEHKAFRYLDLGNNTGRLIIPLRISGWYRRDFFDGFVVYRISESAIEPHFNITHRSGTEDLYYSMCYTCAWLQDRSFVVEGNLMTIKGHSIVSTDLDTTERNWMLPLQFGDGSNCCYW